MDYDNTSSKPEDTFEVPSPVHRRKPPTLAREQAQYLVTRHEVSKVKKTSATSKSI